MHDGSGSGVSGQLRKGGPGYYTGGEPYRASDGDRWRKELVIHVAGILFVRWHNNRHYAAGGIMKRYARSVRKT